MARPKRSIGGAILLAILILAAVLGVVAGISAWLRIPELQHGDILTLVMAPLLVALDVLIAAAAIIRFCRLVKSMRQ